MGWFRKPECPLGTGGSNPSLSAIACGNGYEGFIAWRASARAKRCLRRTAYRPGSASVPSSACVGVGEIPRLLARARGRWMWWARLTTRAGYARSRWERSCCAVSCPGQRESGRHLGNEHDHGPIACNRSVVKRGRSRHRGASHSVAGGRRACAPCAAGILGARRCAPSESANEHDHGPVACNRSVVKRGEVAPSRRVSPCGGRPARLRAVRRRHPWRAPMRAKQTLRRGVRVAEGARLESVCVGSRHRGFESLPLRQSKSFERDSGFGSCDGSDSNRVRPGTEQP